MIFRQEKSPVCDNFGEQNTLRQISVSKVYTSIIPRIGGENGIKKNA